jgi:hypothetical protein
MDDERNLRGVVETDWFPREGKDGKTEVPAILQEALRDLRKRRSPKPLTRFRFVGVRDGECGFELPDHPELAPVWVHLERDVIERREED